MDFSSVDGIRGEGFIGLKSVCDLHTSRCVDVPPVPGVYLVLRNTSGPPSFRAASPGGHFKDSDDLVVCWRPCLDVDAVDLEGSLIQDFRRVYGKRPFANLRD